MVRGSRFVLSSLLIMIDRVYTVRVFVIVFFVVVFYRMLVAVLVISTRAFIHFLRSALVVFNSLLVITLAHVASSTASVFADYLAALGLGPPQLDEITRIAGSFHGSRNVATNVSIAGCVIYVACRLFGVAAEQPLPTLFRSQSFSPLTLDDTTAVSSLLCALVSFICTVHPSLGQLTALLHISDQVGAPVRRRYLCSDAHKLAQLNEREDYRLAESSSDRDALQAVIAKMLYAGE